MSETYERDLVTVESSAYERVSAATVAAAFLTMMLAAATLFGWVPVEGTVGGLSGFVLFGTLLTAMGASVLGLGASSWLDLFETSPDRVSGLVTGSIFGALWFVTAGLLGTTSLGTLAWYTVAPLAGLGTLALVVLTPEDVGSTLPVGIPVTAAGLAVVSGVVGPGWAYSPATLSATFPAHVVVPVLAVVCSLLAGWTAGKAYSGFGTRGRQTGAYLLISLVVYAVLAVLVLLVLFILRRGFAPLVENLSVGAATGLLLSVLPAVLAAARLEDGIARSTRFGTARSLLALAVLAASGLLALGFAGVLVLGSAVSAAGVTVTPVTRVGTGPAFLVLAVLLALAWTRYEGIPVLQAPDTVPRSVKGALLVGGLVGFSAAGLGLVSPGVDPIVGLVLTPAAAAVAVAVAAYPLVVLVRRRLAAGAVDPVPELQLGVAAGLGYLALAVAFELASGLVAVGIPALPVLGRRVAVSVAAQGIVLAFLAYGLALWIGRVRRDSVGEGSETERSATAEYTGQQIRLAAVGVLGAATLLVAHAIVTVNQLTVLGGALTVTPFGSLDWPFLTNPSQGLGVQTGVMPAIVGTVWLVAGAVLMAVPLAVGAAVYLTEYAEESLLTRTVEIATNGLWSTPSIVFGLFGLAFIVPRFGNSPSLFAGQLVLGFMLLPLVLITSREAMKAVPDEYRDASAALGVSKWQTIRSVVIPAAMPGVITGVILGVGRIAGETAPILLVTRGPNFPSQGPGVLGSFQVGVGPQPPFLHVTNPALLDRASALPYQLYAIITAGVGENAAFGWGTALVLLGVVLSFYAIGIASRRYFRRKLEQ